MELIDKFISLIAPYECVGCGGEGKIICEPCATSLLVRAYSSCAGCGRVTKNFEICRSCKSLLQARNIWVAFDYNKAAKEIVNAYKYKSNISASGFMSKGMSGALPIYDFVVTSVPSATDRVRKRGFDHTSRLAKEVANINRLPYQKLIYREGSTRQVGANKKDRFIQVRDVYHPVDISSIKGKDILVVDDVLTTGATISSAARALKRAGAKNVFGLVFAKKM